MNWSMWWPIGLLVLSNVFYQICSKGMPEDFHPLAATALTYLIGAVFACVLYLIINPKGSLFGEFKHFNWQPVILGFAIVGLEVGAMYMYRAGWNVSTGALVHSTIASICLIILGMLAYHETISFTQLGGIVLCLVGLVLINK